MQIDASAFLADPELIAALTERAMPISCEADRVLFQQGEVATGVFIVQQGEVTLTMNTLANDPVLCLRAKAGSLLGLPGIIANQPYSLTACAHRGSCILFVSKADFTSLMAGNSQLSIKVLQVLAAEVRTARQALYA